MLRTEIKTIGDTEYQVRQLNAVQGRDVFLRFAKLVAPALAKVAGGAAEAEEKGVAKAAFIEAVSAVATSVTKEDQDFFCDVFAAHTEVVSYGDDGKKRTPKLSTIMALHFAGDRLPDLYAWLVFCFEVNFGSFFAKLGVTRVTSGAPKTE